jgi:endoglucanase Acf2
MKTLPLLFLLPFAAAIGQEPVTVGKASHAASPPLGKMIDQKSGLDLVAEVEKRRLYLVEDRGQSIPSNKWFQNLLFQQYGTGLWAMPHKVDATAEGIEVFHVNSFSGDGVRAISEYPLVVTGRDFKPLDSRAKSWSDWMVSFRAFESDTRFLDVTLGEGMPAVWCEFTGLAPILAPGGHPGKGTRDSQAAEFFDLGGKAVSLPVTGEALGITHRGRNFAVFAPAGTSFEQSHVGIAVTFAGKSTFLVICPLPDREAIAYFHRHAYAVPRDTRLSWKYDRAAGKIETTWTVTTEALKPGAPPAVIQGFLPHQWRENVAELALDGPVYRTIRGPLKCAAGDNFTIAHPYHGVLPNLPKPGDVSKVGEILAAHFTDPAKKLGADTYWGGKDLQRYAQAAFMANAAGDPSFDAILGKVRAALTDWFTFTPGEKERFFAWYPRRKGLVGFNAAYGSQHFTDTHFHQGYFVYAAALLSQLDPDFAAGYGDFARLLAKNYANYDAKDNRFPRFRTFDIWRGHSFADGNGFPGGNNQESTGEAINSWAGLILLGEALGDEEMTAAGVMGYSFESRANVEYWFDPQGDVFPDSYAHDACGMIWCDSIVWGTWFTASPSWIYGIQWLPAAPHAAYYDREPDFITKVYAGYEREQAAFEEREAARNPKHVKKPVTFESLGGELASYHLGFLMHGDAPRVVAELDKLWAKPGNAVARDPWMAALHWQANSLASLGRVDWTCHADSPTAMVYANETKKTRTLVAWNPATTARTVRFFNGDRLIGELSVPSRSLVSGLAVD